MISSYHAGHLNTTICCVWYKMVIYVYWVRQLVSLLCKSPECHNILLYFYFYIRRDWENKRIFYVKFKLNLRFMTNILFVRLNIQKGQSSLE
jgi:hypothetical protein